MRPEKKNIRENEADFMNNSLRKAVMIRSKLKNKYIKNSTTENHLANK